MTRSDTLLTFIIDELLLDDSEELTVDDELLMSERIDSLGLIRLITFIGDELELEVPYEDVLIENFSTVRTIDAYLSDLDGSGASSESAVAAGDAA